MAGKTMDLTCIGSSNVDIIMNVQDVMKFELVDANVPDLIKKYTAIEYSSKLNVNSVKVAPGGSAANVAANLGALGLKTAYIGKLGNDFFGKLSIEDMKASNVDTDGVILTDDDATGVSVILITPFGKDRSILAYKGANNYIHPEEIKEEWLERSKHLQWTSLTSDCGIASIEKCVDYFRDDRDGEGLVFGCPSISIIKNNRAGALRLVKKSDVLCLNLEELEALTGVHGVIDGMKAALTMGPGIVACTNGKEGAYITDGKELLKAGIYDVAVMDTTGAGDAFASGLIHAISSGMELERVLKYGSAVSAFECSELGVRDGVPHEFKVLDDFIEENPLEITRTRLS